MTYWSEKARQSARAGKAPIFKSRGASALAFSQSLSRAHELSRAWKPGMDWPAVEFPYEFELRNCVQALRWESYPGAGITARTPKSERHSKWWMAGLVFEGNMHRQSSDPRMKQRICSQC